MRIYIVKILILFNYHFIQLIILLLNTTFSYAFYEIWVEKVPLPPIFSLKFGNINKIGFA